MGAGGGGGCQFWFEQWDRPRSCSLGQGQGHWEGSAERLSLSGPVYPFSLSPRQEEESLGKLEARELPSSTSLAPRLEDRFKGRRKDRCCFQGGRAWKASVASIL